VSFEKHKAISHDTYYLGKHAHPRHRLKEVEGYAFLHNHRDSRAGKLSPSTSKATHFGRNNHTSSSKKSSAEHRKRQLGTTLDCTEPIAVGAVWKTSLGFYINSLNTQQLSTRYLTSAILHATDAWNCALRTDNRLVLGPLLAVRPSLSGRDITIDSPDGSNIIGLGTIDGKHGTIAVTIVWGIFSGPIPLREIVEFKMIFDANHYRFGNSSLRAGVIDFEATATHEMGHAFGNEDIYDPQCADVTMYGTSAENETKKRTLEVPDVVGIQSLYPPE
jgi:hypothetical protein